MVDVKSDLKKSQAEFKKAFLKKKKDFEASKKSAGTAKAHGISRDAIRLCVSIDEDVPRRHYQLNMQGLQGQGCSVS